LVTPIASRMGLLNPSVERSPSHTSKSAVLFCTTIRIKERSLRESLNRNMGGGKVIRPIYILLDGRATKHFNGISIPTDAIAVEAARKYLRATLTNLNLERDVVIDCRLGTGSTDLREVFKPCQNTPPRANDTSFGVGHAPFSETETIVLAISDYIDQTLRSKYPVIGQDIKIMGLREDDTITLTLACAMVDRYCSGLADYIEYKNKIQEEHSEWQRDSPRARSTWQSIPPTISTAAACSSR